MIIIFKYHGFMRTLLGFLFKWNIDMFILNMKHIEFSQLKKYLKPKLF